MDARENDVNGCGCAAGSPAAETLEKDIGQTRARLDDTVGALEERLTVRNLANSAAHAALHGTGAASRAALRAIKNNPVPAALVGLGLAWMIMDKYRSQPSRGSRQRGGYSDGEWLSPGATYTPSGRSDARPGAGIGARAAEGVSTAAHAVGDATRSGAEWARDKGMHAAEWAKDRVSTAARGIGEKASAGASALGEQASHLAERGRDLAGRARQGFWDTYDDNPLMVGAAAFAVGLVGGLSIPTSETENRLMGRASRDLKDKVRSAGEEALDAGKRVAARAAETLETTSSDAETIGGRLAGTATSVTEAIADEAAIEADRVARKVNGS